MSPLGIQIMLHYYAHCDDFRGGDFRAPAVADLLDAFTSEGMLTTEKRRGIDRRFDITERGEAYVKALCAVPYPINRWVMPEGFEALQHRPTTPAPDGEGRKRRER